MIKHGVRSCPFYIDVLYREFCRARLAEMRKQLLLSGSHQYRSRREMRDRPPL